MRSCLGAQLESEAEILMKPDILPGRIKKLIWESPERAGKTLRQVHKEMNKILSDLGEDEITYGHLSSKMLPDGPGKLDPIQLAVLCAVTDTAALDEIERGLGRVAFLLYQALQGSDEFYVKGVAEATTEYAEWLQKVAEFMSPDSESGAGISVGEAKVLIEEGDDVIRVFAEKRAYLQRIIDEAKNQ
jgi:hypothetical protein